jgi:hypothetical protein
MSSAYGRLYRRRKAARFSPGIPCSICGEPVRTRAEFTLHRDPPVSRGGTAFDEKPAHRSCNLDHGRRLGGMTSAREGAIPLGPIAGPAEVHRRDGSVVIVEPGERYEP